MTIDERKEFAACRSRHFWRLRAKGWNGRQAWFGAETFAYMRVSLIKH